MTDDKKKVLGICIFCALLFLLLYASIRKTNKNTYNNSNIEYVFTLEQKHNEKEEESVKWEKAPYQKYEKWLLNNDSSRNSCSIFTEGEQWRNNPEVYCELWGESFFGNLGADGLVGIKADMFSEGEPITGGLLAEKTDGDSLGMRIVTHDEMGYVEYFYYDSGSLCYLSCRGLKERGEDLPEYAVCTDVFAHYKIPEAYEEAETDWNEWVEKCHGAVKGELEEYCIVGERIYVIDREKQALADITNTSRWYVNQWIVQEAERVSCSMKVTPEVYEKISGWLPEKFFAGKEVGVCDLNQDGKDDYVAVVYQEKFNAYRKEELIRDHDEIWLFLSNAEGEYDKKILLADMPFYCPELRLSGKGRLVCGNFIGFESYINDPCRTEYFLYDQEREDFYFYKACQAKSGNIIIDDKETIGECNIKDYYLEKYYETEGWELSEDSPVEVWNDRATVFHDYHMEYRNKEEEVEREVNQKIAQFINIYMEDLNKNRSGGISRGSANIKYADSRVFCGDFSGPCGGISVIIDAQSGLPIDITKMITKKEMLEICRKGMKSMDRNKVSPDEMEVYLQYVQAGYETASSLTPCSDMKKSEEKIQIKFLITAWGIECVCVRIKDDTEEYSGFMIDKEYFIDTPLWKYMEPDSFYSDRKGNRLYCSRKLVVSEDSYQICQTDYTKMNYRDGYYYYPSSADHFYLYKSDGKRNECLAKQVPKEIYPNNNWIYFINASDGQTLYKICTDGTGMKQVLDQEIDRFIFLEDEVYYISGVDGYLYSWQEETGSKLLYQGNCRWTNTDG